MFLGSQLRQLGAVRMKPSRWSSATRVVLWTAFILAISSLWIVLRH